MKEMIKELVEYRELLWSLTVRDIRVRYKQAVLGMLWALFTPMALMFIFTFVFSHITVIDTGGIPYPLFAYCGLLPWTFFSGSLSGAMGSLVSNRSLVTKVYFPREVFPLSKILSKLVDLGISFTLVFVLMIYYKIPFHGLLLPFVLIIQIFFTIGLGMFLSIGYLFYRDVRYVFDVIIMLWMFSTSVVYPIHSTSPIVTNILSLNPMIPIIDAYRALIIHGVLPDLGGLILPIGISLFIFFFGMVLFS